MVFLLLVRITQGKPFKSIFRRLIRGFITIPEEMNNLDPLLERVKDKKWPKVREQVEAAVEANAEK